MNEIKINIPATVLNELHTKGKAKFNHEHFYPGYVTLYNEDVDKSELTQHFDRLLTESYIILNNWSINKLIDGDIVPVTFNNSGRIEELELKQA